MKYNQKLTFPNGDETIVGLQCRHCQGQEFTLVKILTVIEPGLPRERHYSCDGCGDKFIQNNLVEVAPPEVSGKGE